MSTSMILLFIDTATTEIYTLSLHDALPIFDRTEQGNPRRLPEARPEVHSLRRPVAREAAVRPHVRRQSGRREDRKSTRLNSSHSSISYAVFCLKKKRKQRGRGGSQLKCKRF